MSNINHVSNETQLLNKIKPSNFENFYIITTRNEFKMGAENPIIKFETESKIFFKQEVKGNSIINSIETISIKGNTDNENMKSNLDRMLLLADISKEIIIERDANGKMRSLLNLKNLKLDWEDWKKNKLQYVFLEPEPQKKFIKNYEQGLDKMDDGIKKSFQYSTLMPEIYNLNSNQTTETELVSKLIADMLIKYNFTITNTIENEDSILASLKSVVTNKEDLKNNYAIPLYEKHPEFSISDYRFKILVDYTFDKTNLKMRHANFLLLEQLHDHLQYKLEINIKEFHNL